MDCGPEPSIERPSQSDAESMVDCWVVLARGQRAYGSHLYARENADAVHAAVSHSIATGGARVARADDRVVGFVTFGPESGAYQQDVRRGLVHNLYVADDYRDSGVGAALLAAAEEALAADGADVVALEVMAGNEDARRFYAREGYREHRYELEKAVGGAEESDTHSKEDR